MKVLHLISGGDIGGAKTHVLTLLNKLNSYKDCSACLLCIMESTFTEDAKKLGIPITVISQRSRFDFFSVLSMGKFINNEGFDIVHCHGARANFLAVFLRFITKVPMLTTIHSDYRLDFKGVRYKQLFFTPLNALSLRSFKYFLAVTNVFKQMLISRGFKADRIHVAYNGVDFNEAIITLTPDVFLKKYNISYNKDFVYIGTLSRLHPVKGVNFLLEAAKVILEKYSNVVFLIAGDGTEMQKYKQFVSVNNLSDKIHFLGHIDDIKSFYATIDINTLTSISESFPYSLLEGARQRKATVASAVGGVVEMIDNGKTGYLFESSNVSELIKCLSSLIDDESLRNKFGNAFYELACAEFSIDSMTKTHFELYNYILKENEK